MHTIKNPDESRSEGVRGIMQKPYDGMAELWFDSPEVLLKTFTDKAGIAAAAELLSDEKQFIDLAQSPAWMAYDCPQINPAPETLVASPDSPYVKLYYLLNHPSDQSFSEVQQYWRQQHGPLVRSFAAPLQVMRYIQVHRIEHEFNPQFAESRGCKVAPYFGHAELWHDQRVGGNQIPEAIRASKALYEDEAGFIDFSRSCMWYDKEHVFIDRR